MMQVSMGSVLFLAGVAIDPRTWVLDKMPGCILVGAFPAWRSASLPTLSRTNLQIFVPCRESVDIVVRTVKQ